MTAERRRVCDCLEPCCCYAEGYAAGKDKAYFEVLASLTAHLTLRTAVLTLMARSSPGIFELVEAWTLDEHGE